MRTLKYAGGASSSLATSSNGSRTRDKGRETGLSHETESTSSTVLARMTRRPPTSSTSVTAEHARGGGASGSRAACGGGARMRQPAYSRSAAPSTPETASRAIAHAGSGPVSRCVAVDDEMLSGSDVWAC